MSEPATHKYKVILCFEWKDATVCRIIEDNEWSIRNVCKCFQIKKKKKKIMTKDIFHTLFW